MSGIDWEGLAKARGLELLAAKSQIAELEAEVAGITRANDANVATHNAIVRAYMTRIAELEAEVAGWRRRGTIGALMGADAYYDPKQQSASTSAEPVGHLESLITVEAITREAVRLFKNASTPADGNVSRETPTHATPIPARALRP